MGENIPHTKIKLSCSFKLMILYIQLQLKVGNYVTNSKLSL